MTITRSQRAEIRNIIAASSNYDAESFRITRDGEVHARIDYDKAPDARLNRPTGYVLVGSVSDMLADARG